MSESDVRCVVPTRSVLVGTGGFGVDVRQIWGRFGINLGSVWGRFGIGLGSAWDRFGVGLGSIRGRFGVDLHFTSLLDAHSRGTSVPSECAVEGSRSCNGTI